MGGGESGIKKGGMKGKSGNKKMKNNKRKCSVEEETSQRED